MSEFSGDSWLILRETCGPNQRFVNRNVFGALVVLNHLPSQWATRNKGANYTENASSENALLNLNGTTLYEFCTSLNRCAGIVESNQNRERTD